ncbi:hypothetical protein TD95_003496 [Thielaviopsis punctulata]|uniref:peptidyl-tRNA hydrolase n=1 Tax=Thielaviopsis punctulata TaxID=72032 RepID=A0A0F4ZLM2_9PEZI|nr:hypothetical protein TD95_003496 [Thielaviopsis punctulata]
MIEKFLIISLGNPKPYLETFHSAGHLAIKSLQTLLPNQPAWTPQRIGKQKAQISLGPKFMLVQSPTLMNVSGPWVAKTFKELVGDRPERVGFLVLHDDLEGELGHVRIRQWKSSHRGHNGLKSINASLRKEEWPHMHWAKIAIGIGRPEARTSDAVSRYVLRPLQMSEKAALNNEAPPKVVELLQELEMRWSE